jgi:hypothetical protein
VGEASKGPGAGRGAQAQLQAFLDQARQTRPLLGGQSLGVGKQLIVDVQSRLHVVMVQKSV